ncbi:hypothetical protein M0804_009810 [Polistes exclamans]|nr:hypothetical protein M0804_009810 [Polistes exclamans]
MPFCFDTLMSHMRDTVLICRFNTKHTSTKHTVCPKRSELINLYGDVNEVNFEQKETGQIKTKYEFIPSIGTHFFNYRGNWIRVKKTSEQQTLDLHMGIPWETVP